MPDSGAAAPDHILVRYPCRGCDGTVGIGAEGEQNWYTLLLKPIRSLERAVCDQSRALMVPSNKSELD